MRHERCQTPQNLFTEAQRLAEQSIAIRMTNMPKNLLKSVMPRPRTGIDWSQLKALAVADAADKEADESKRLPRLIAKAVFASAYADMLGLRKDERKPETRSSSPQSPKPEIETAASNTTRRRADSGEAALSSSQAPQPLTGGAASSFHDPNDAMDLRNMSFHRGPKAVA